MKKLFRLPSKAKSKLGRTSDTASTSARDTQSVGSAESNLDGDGASTKNFMYSVDVKSKDFNKLHKAAWNNDIDKAKQHVSKKTNVNLLDKECR